MELNVFMTSPVTRGWIEEVVRADLQENQQSNRAAQYFPRVFQDVTEIDKTIYSLAAPIIAADVAPLSTGRTGEGIQEQRIRGSLIDSAARYGFQGKKLEQLRALLSIIESVPGDTVTLRNGVANRALDAYFGFMNTRVLQPLYMNMNRKDWTLMRTGKAWQDGSRDDDFTRPPLISVYGTQQTTVVTAGSSTNIYGGADADFFQDIQDAVNRAAARGWKIREVVMTSATRQTILGLTSTKTAVGGMSLNVVTGGQVEVQMQQGNATAEAFNSALAARDLPPVIVEDGVWRDQVRAEGDPAGPVGTFVTQKYVKDGEVILVPENSPEDDAFIQEEFLLSGLVDAPNPTAKGVHVVGRPTAQDRGPRLYLFGPYYQEGENPSLTGSGIAAHMPFLAGPGGFEILVYAR